MRTKNARAKDTRRGEGRRGKVVSPLVRSGSIKIFGYAFNCPQAIVRVEVELKIDVEVEVAVPSRVKVKVSVGG